MPELDVRLIAFYLPQFHPIPENDEWWEKGFTEWTNVSKTPPQFMGHHQPRLPSDLGFYDLRLPETRKAQADLAREYGIEGFCYYHYWFCGKRLLERPFNEVLKSGEPDFPFCLAWANESWSRRWLGENRDLLIEQTYSEEDDLNHAKWLVRAFSDRRYIRIHDRPLFLIYRPKDLPDPQKTTDVFRNECVKNGLKEPYLVGINSPWHLDCRSIGFDDTLDFMPQLGNLPDFTNDNPSDAKRQRNLKLGISSSKLKLYDYSEALDSMLANKNKYTHSVIPSIFVGWDNTPRRGENGIIILNSSPGKFGEKLKELIQSVQKKPREERIVFLNAWNEWAEGNYLEPDLKFGRAYLEAVRSALAGEGQTSAATAAEIKEPQPAPVKIDEIKKFSLSYYLFNLSVNKSADFVPPSHPDLPDNDIRLIAFYLPQFHPIPENDKWWGKGFTEWTNVTKALPQFVGHIQPKLPGELGFYDLRNPEIQEQQVELARQYGIFGFCFHFYWFDGKRLLERPLEQFISNPAIDFPFCINWANENWTRRWDGKDKDLLIVQKHSPEDDIAFIQYVSKYLRHSNYITINSKPLLIVYRPALLPDPAKTAGRWRKWCIDNGIGEIYLALTHSFEHLDPLTIGFDAAIEFAPNTFPLSNLGRRFTMINPTFGGRLVDYYSAVELARKYRKPNYKRFRGICPGWDNEARRPGKSVILANSSPDAYGEWLRLLCEFTETSFPPEERLIFINAWNEWAEGAYLEPDRRNGHAYLRATANALSSFHRRTQLSHYRFSILFVSHDAAAGGAQSVLLDIIEWFRKYTSIDFKMLCLQGGEWLYRFRELGETLVLNEAENVGYQTAPGRRFSDFCSSPVDLIYCNSVASGKAYHLLRSLNTPIIMHFHELEMSIKRYAKDYIRDILRHSSHFVACSGAVRENLLKKYEADESKISTIYSSIRPDNSLKVAADPEKSELKKKLGLDEKAFVIFGCGLTMAFRKGADLFIDVARILRKKGLDDFHFLWVGVFDGKERDKTGRLWADYLRVLRTSGLDRYVTFMGKKPNPREYFRAGDIFLLPSREDPFPLVALEAAECGLPVVCFADAGGMPDFVEDDAGFVVPFADAEAMAEKVVELMENRDLGRQLGSRARQKLLDKFTPGQTVPQILSLCRNVAKKRPAVSVIVPNYNHARYLPERLDSIFSQSYKDFEVIILDDASSDNSIDVIERYKDRADVRVVRNEKNSGSPFPQWLKAFDLARADILWIAESDDMCDPKFLEALLPAFRTSDVKLAYADSYVIDENSRITGDYVTGEYLTSLSQTKWKKSYRVSATTEINDGLGVKNTVLNISAVLFRKLDLDEEFRKTLDGMRIAGDWYLIAHAIKNGKVHFNDRKLNYHRRHPESVIGKMVSERKLEDFFGEFHTVQQFIFSNYRLNDDFYRKWESYLRKQWNDFCPNRDFEELKAYYPLDEMREKILANIAESEKGDVPAKIPAVSIIIPLLNNLELTRKCLSSLTDNTDPEKYELIIVDNGSTDGTGDYLDSLNGKIKVIRNEHNLGFARACNQGAGAASAGYLLFLNNDTEPQPGWIEALVAVLDNDGSVAAVGSKLLFPDGTIQHAGVVVIDDRKLPDPLVARHIHYQQSSALTKANIMTSYQALTAACLMIRKSAFEDAGGFDEEYWNGYEDVDLCFKLQQKGWKLVYQPKSVVIHHESKSGPERFSRVKENIARLHNKWLGKIKPDIIIEKDGSIIWTDAERIKSYSIPGTAESELKESRLNVQKGLTSIIILTHNQLEDTKKCLDSVRRFTPEPHEIIFVDNGSTDGTVDYLRAEVANSSNIWVISNADNRGFAAGNNQGISVAEGDYVLLLNNDTVVTEGWLGRMLDVFRRNRQIGIVGPMSNYVSGPQLVTDTPYKDLDQMHEFAAEWTKKHDGQSFPIYRVVGFCLLTKKEVIKRIGGLDERFGSGNFEDDDFCGRAALAGYEARVARDVYIHHAGSRTFKGAGIDYKGSLLRNWGLFKTKWGIPADTPYEKGYYLPLQPPQGFNSYIPLPDVLIDHQVEDSNDRWLADVSSKEIVTQHIPGLTSIIVLTSGEFSHTKRCIKSIRKNTHEPHEIIAVDNGSSVKTSSWLRKQANEGKDIRVIGNPPCPPLEKGGNEKEIKNGTTGMHGGYAKACNEGIRESSGEYIAILTDDVMVPKEWLSGMLECLNVSSDTGIVGPMIYGIEGRQGVSATAFHPDELDRFAREFRETRRHRWAASQNVSARGVLFRHDLTGKIGPFDEQFGAGDFAVDDYCLRASLEGFRTVIAGDVVLRHEKSTERTDNKGQTALDKTLFQDKWDGIDSSNPLFKKLLAVNALQLAAELNQKAQVDDAVSALLNATRHSGDKRLHRSLVDILIENKRYKDGLDILNKMPEEMRKTENWYEQLASCASGLEQFEKAEQYADEALTLNSNSAAALNIKGFVAFKKGNRSEAEDLFRKATESDKGFGEAYCNLAGLRWLAGDKESAIILFEKAFILSPSVPDVALSYYTIAANLKQFARAADLFREAVALYPLNKKLKFTLIDILLHQAEYDQALKEAEEAMVTFGTDDQTLSLALGIREKIGAMRIGKAEA